MKEAVVGGCLLCAVLKDVVHLLEDVVLDVHVTGDALHDDGLVLATESLARLPDGCEEVDGGFHE